MLRGYCVEGLNHLQQTLRLSNPWVKGSVAVLFTSKHLMRESGARGSREPERASKIPPRDTGAIAKTGAWLSKQSGQEGGRISLNLIRCGIRLQVGRSGELAGWPG